MGGTRKTGRSNGGGAGPARPSAAAVLGHEIRGPLGAVVALSDLLLARDLPGDQRGLVELIRLAGSHARAVAEDLVDDAGLSSGRLRPAAAAFEPAETARTLAALWAPLAGAERPVEVRCADDLPPRIVSDERRIRQILFNLVSNATRYAAGGAITLRVARSARGIVFEVRDEGGGPAEPGGGLGIGLSVSRRLAAALGGRLRLARRRTGTVAQLEIPVVLDAANPDEGRTAAPAPTAEVVPAAPRPTPDWPLARSEALVVDDSAISRLLMTAMLTSFDMAVSSVSGGGEAEAFVAARRPDVIVMDWSLAGETGAEVIDRLRRTLGEAMPPIVLVTGERRLPPVAGIAARVAKPFTPRELFEALSGALRPARAVAAVR